MTSPMLESPAFLNVKPRSPAAAGSGRRRATTGWRRRSPRPPACRRSSAASSPAAACRPAEAAAYLAPALRDLMPDPSRLRDMDRAAARFWAAVQARRADRGLRRLRRRRRRVGGPDPRLAARSSGRSATLYVPDRIEEGYGPNVPAMQALGASHDLIVCVDCGTLSHEPIAAAGCDVIVLDHHLGAETLPPALAVVNPNRQDEDGALGYLCAAAVVFLMLVAVNRLMRAEGAPGPDLLALPRPRRARHRGGRGAARRAQPGAGAPGPRGDGAPGRGRGSRRWRRRRG